MTNSDPKMWVGDYDKEHPKVADPEYRGRILASGRRAGKSKRISEAREQFEREHAALFVNPDTEVLGVLTGQVPVRSMPIAECDQCPVWTAHSHDGVDVPLDSPRE